MLLAKGFGNFKNSIGVKGGIPDPEVFLKFIDIFFNFF